MPFLKTLFTLGPLKVCRVRVTPADVRQGAYIGRPVAESTHIECQLVLGKTRYLTVVYSHEAPAGLRSPP